MATSNYIETIKQVINGKGTKAFKLETLVKAYGLREKEANMCYTLYHEATPRAIRETFKYTFGVEIECGMNANHFCEDARGAGLDVDYVDHYAHSNGNRAIRVCTDSSVHVDGHSYEAVTPVLNGNGGFATLKKMCDSLAVAGAKVNKSCGLHVHIGAANLTDQQYINVFKNYKVLEPVIDTFMAQSRRANNNHYCATLQDHSFDYCRTKEDVRRVLSSRYHKVNAESYGVHKTIEFRQHQGSTDYEKISNWVKFVAKLVKYSMTNVIESCNSISEIPFLTAEEKRFFEARKAALA